MMSWAFIVESVPFTKAVVAGETSLGGSESACLGLARALQARGHSVHIFAGRLSDDAVGPDSAGVQWHKITDFTDMNKFLEWDVVCSLRMLRAFAGPPIHARLRLLWNQDLMIPGTMQSQVMSIAWAIDHSIYVSEYHRRQWEQLQPELAGIGWTTRNGYDPQFVPATSHKDPNRIIHISRPERGLGPLLQMWPLLKKQKPEAELQICRYSSMYDQGPGSWSDVCSQWDRAIAHVNKEVGGITYLGELNKKQLYQAIADAAVMWYPGLSTFAETNCIAALESAACGTPFVGSYRGALPETSPTGILIPGIAEADPVYHEASVNAVLGLMDGCAKNGFDYRKRQKDGQHEAAKWSYAKLAAQWESQVAQWFTERSRGNKLGVMRQLLHEDDHVAARAVAGDLLLGETEAQDEANAAFDFCCRVIDGKDQNADDYGERAIQDPLEEIKLSKRFETVAPLYKDCTRVLDVACGNGSFALCLAQQHPHIKVHGLDYSPANITAARKAAEQIGVADRITFEQRTVYDFDKHELHDDWYEFVRTHQAKFDGLFCGEFVEHVANYHALIDGVEEALLPSAFVMYTCPSGAYVELHPRELPVKRGHVHRFAHDDIAAVWGPKAEFYVDFMDGGLTEAGTPIGSWLIRYQYLPNRPAGQRPLTERIARTRPRQRLSVGIIAKNAEQDLARCLASVYKVADEIVVADTGSHDLTAEIAKHFGEKVRFFEIDPVEQQPEGFAGARNEVLSKCAGEWFLWIDTDEQLTQGHFLRKYLDGQVFNGYVIHQTHLYLDGPPTHDIPVRLFRNTGKVKFFGCVHEQPQDGDCNADIMPTLDAQDLNIAHTGYLTPEGREDKRVHRNLPLLKKDAQVFGDRVLGKVLRIREAVIEGDLQRVTEGVGEYARRNYLFAIKTFVEHFDDPTHKYHKIARPWYEAALRHLGLGWEQEIAMAGRQGGLEGRRPQPERLWVRDPEEYRRLMTFKVDELVKAMTPVPTITDPDELIPRDTREAVSA